MITVLNWLKRFAYSLLFIFIGLIVYDILISGLISNNGKLYYFLGLWLISAYIFLPRIHRFLTRFYVPDYFIGRVRTGDGLLGDPVNCAVVGNETQLINAMKKAGWEQADPITLKTSWRMITSSVTKKSYPKAPVSNLYLFGNRHDLAFQKEVNNNPRARHHVRFWKAPTGWYLPGGYKVDWVGAATYDTSVGLSLFTGQVTHKIAENTDEERDYVAKSLGKSGRIEVIKHYSTAYHSRNGGGDSIKTDGSLVIANLVGKN